jgi:hypothetical protein
VRGTGEVDLRSDIFSMGIILYEMLTGDLPFIAENHTGIITKILSEAPRPPAEVCHDFPAQAEPVVMRALAKTPEERFQSASEMLESIRALTTSGERHERLAMLSTGLKRTVAGGDLGRRIKSDRGRAVASDVLSEMTGQDTPDVWTRTFQRTARRLKWPLGLGGLAFVALVLGAVGMLVWNLATENKPETTRVVRPAPPELDSPPKQPVVTKIVPEDSKVEVKQEAPAEAQPIEISSPLMEKPRASHGKKQDKTAPTGSASGAADDNVSAQPPAKKYNKGGRGTLFGRDFE